MNHVNVYTSFFALASFILILSLLFLFLVSLFSYIHTNAVCVHYRCAYFERFYVATRKGLSSQCKPPQNETIHQAFIDFFFFFLCSTNDFIKLLSVMLLWKSCIFLTGKYLCALITNHSIIYSTKANDSN